MTHYSHLAFLKPATLKFAHFAVLHVGIVVVGSHCTCCRYEENTQLNNMNY